VVFGMLAPLFGTPSLLILDLSTPTPPSNPISKLSCSVRQAFLAPINSIHALLIHIYKLILEPKLFCITLGLRLGFGLGLGLELGPHHCFAFGLVHCKIQLDIMQMLSVAVNRVTHEMRVTWKVCITDAMTYMINEHV